MAINPSLCKEHNFQFAVHYSGMGKWKPKHTIILFCTRCAKLKKQSVDGD